MEQLYTIEFERTGSPIHQQPIRNLTLEQLAKEEERLHSGVEYRVVKRGWLTTIKEFAPQVAAESRFTTSRLDEPCIAQVLGDDTATYCSGRAIVGFYDPDPIPTRRPAYIVLNTHPEYGPLGMMLVQSG